MKQLNTKIIFYFSVLSLCVAIAIGFFILSYFRLTIVEEAESVLKRTSEDASRILSARNEVQFVFMEGIAQSELWLSDTVSMDEQLAHLTEQLSPLEHFLRVGIADTEGRLYMHERDGIGVRKIDISERTYYSQTMNGKRGLMNPSRTINPEFAGQIVVVYAVPIKRDGEVVGAIVASSYSQTLSDLIADMGYGQNGYAFLLDKRGTVVAHPDRSLVQQQYNIFSDTGASLTSFTDSAQRALNSGSSGTVDFTYGEDAYYAGYARVPESDWTVFIVADKGEVLHLMQPLQRTFFIYTGIILALNLLIHRRLKDEIRKEAHILEMLANYDSLTGALNRHAGIEFLDQWMHGPCESLTVVFIDIDNLKRVNDRQGHQAGDALIIDIVNAIVRHIRSGDKCVRIGGDEFFLVLPNCDVDNAEKIMCTITDDLPDSAHISYGIAAYNADVHHSPKELLDVADARMYAQKQLRKNTR